MRVMISVVLAATLSLCGCTNGSGNDDVNGVRRSLISEGANRIVTEGDDLPRPTPSISYRGANSFDVELYSSLLSLNDVRVNFASPQPDLPDRIALWTSAIERREGMVTTCDISTASGLSGALLLSLGRLVAGWMFGALQDYLLYRPAANVSAIIEVDSRDRLARSVRFVSRDQFTEVKNSYRRCNA